jgi:hypothetical protein
VVTSIGSATSSTSYTTTLAPIITGATPNTGPVNRVITVTGANFSGPNISGQITKVNGVPIGSFSRSSNSITFAIPAGASTGPITMETSQGLATSAFDFVVASGPAPANDSFAAAQVLTGTTGSVSGNTANATKEPGEPNHANNAGGASVWFSWTAPTNGFYLFNPFNASSSQFGITQAIYTGDSVDSLTLVAAGLTPTGSFTRYGSAAAFNAVAGTTYRIALDGYNGLMADYKLSWSPLDAPTISTFNPTTAYAGQSLTISGTGFVPGATVVIGGVTVSPARLTFNSATSISVSQVPFTSVTGPIVVTTVAGTATSASNLTIVAPPPPSISSFTPTTGLVNTSVTITGTALALGDAAPIVRFNGVPVIGSFTQNSTSLTVRVPPGATTGPITIETSRGIATSATNFVIPAPFISSFSPSGARSGLTVTIDGGNFSGATAVLFNGVSAPFTLVSSTQITATIPDGATTGKIAVVTPNGSAASASDFVVIVPPVITQQPVSQTATVGDTVTLTVAATSNGPLEFWWRRNGQALLSNPTNSNSTLVLTNVSLADAGVYDCQVANNAAVLVTVPATLTVNKATAQVTLGATVATYDGAPKSAAATTTPANLNVLFTYDGNPNPPVNAGTYAVVATIDDPRYAGSASGTLTINPAPATITLGRLDSTFTGSPQGVSYAVAPAGLPVTITYDGSTVPPTNAGTYAVVATISDANYVGQATATFTIRPKFVLVLLNDLAQRYDGTPKAVSTFLDPAGVPITITYNGSTTPPTLPGSYAVEAKVDGPNYTGQTSGTLVITTTALVRHAPELSGGLDGSLQQLTGETLTVGSGAWIASDLLVPGTPDVHVDANATFAGPLDATGASAPDGYSVTLAKNSVVRHVVRRVDPVTMPVAILPPTPVGTRDVVLNSPSEDAGDFATIRDLTVSGAGTLVVPYGTYRHLTANGNITLVLGTPGFNEPAFYGIETLTLNGNARIQIAGPVMLTAANRITLNGDTGDPAHPDWMTIRLASGELLLKGGATLSAHVVAPNGTVTIQSGLLKGAVIADRLRLLSQGTLAEPQQ